MTPSFSAHLVNDVFGDPGLYVEVRWSRRALLFDLGANDPLSPTRLLKIGDVFISHTHMDHFIGFDRILRVALGRGKCVRLYGPPGLIANVEGKLRGYTWNLIDEYAFSLEVREFHPTELHMAVFRASDAFAPQMMDPVPLSGEEIFPVLQEPMLNVHSVALNHRISSLAFALEEPFHVNINKERLHAAGLPVGSWLKEVKRHLWDGKPDDFRFTATLYFEHRQEERILCLGEIRERFVRITRGQKIVYVVDCRYDPGNERKIVSLAQGADVLYCEAPYLACDADKAFARYHLTARQAGLLARQAGVRELVVFHFSPRYTGKGEMLMREAREAWEGSVAGVSTARQGDDV